MIRNNRYIPIIPLCILAAAVSACFADGPVLSKSLRAVTGKDTVRNVWVFFKDRSADRVGEIERRGGKLRQRFEWGNAASFSVHASRLNDISALPFVKSVTPVAVYVRRSVGGSGLAKSAAALPGGYGWHMDMVNLPRAHEYLKAKGLGDPGRGVLMAFFDSGFRLDHTAFSHVKDSGSIVRAYDFVDKDTIVRDTAKAYISIQGDAHGTQVLALAAAYHPGEYMGAAWGARFALARTEDVLIEARVEEDNWVAAVVWAVDSLKADIISSSLGYRDFDSTYISYEYEDMDGKTALVSIAAAEAVKRGVIVVNAMGNEGSDTVGTIVAPADVEGVVSVGAVDIYHVITNFSSTGPTYDGRDKPDVVAPGRDVRVPHPYSADRASYTSNNGTSFSTPIISGILALILQAHPGISADSARARLYASCSRVIANPYSKVDYKYQAGRGLPDALRTVMAGNDVFVKITDSAGIPLQDALINAGGNTYTANEDGCVVLAANRDSLQLKISFRGETLRTLIVDSLPYESVVALESVGVGVGVKDGQVNGGLRIFKAVVRRNNIVRGRLFFSGVERGKPAAAAISTVNGRTIWRQSLPLKPDGSAEFVWDCKNGTKRVAAGVYLLSVRYGGKTVSGKIVVAN